MDQASEAHSSNAPAIETADVESIRSEEPQQPQQQQAEVSSMKLVAIIENLILLGLVSIVKWEFVLEKLKIHPDVASNTELLNLYFTLRQIYNHFSSKIIEESDLSQHKVPLINANEHSLKDLMNLINPLLRKKPYKERLYSHSCINKLLHITRGILSKHFKTNVLNDSDTDCDKIDETTKPKSRPNKSHKRKKSSKSKKVKKIKRNVDLSSEDESAKTKNKQKENINYDSDSSDSNKSSSSSSSSSSASSSDSSASSSSSNSDSDRFDSLFKKSASKKPVIIKQIFQTQKNNMRRKFTTPGEQGRYMVKIELTDVKDLKKCESYKSYWTKVSKKIIFLLNAEDETFKKVEDIIFEKGKEISRMKGTVKDGVKLNSRNAGTFSKF